MAFPQATRVKKKNRPRRAQRTRALNNFFKLLGLRVLRS
jgi:hypothetical protein